jgi:hypothetical protein
MHEAHNQDVEMKTSEKYNNRHRCSLKTLSAEIGCGAAGKRVAWHISLAQQQRMEAMKFRTPHSSKHNYYVVYI